MKLSGHNFNNDLFNSLLDGISKDVELKKSAQIKETPEVNDFFSSTTSQDFNDIQRDELEFIANELTFAANNAKIEVNAEDLSRFAQQVNQQQIRGKALERAAQKFCNHLDRAISAPTGTTKLSAGDLIDQLASHRVIPAGYNTEHGSNDSITGKFMGSSKNPNNIWDSDALQSMAQQAGKDEKRTFGDEEIAKSKKANAEYKEAINAQPELNEAQKAERNNVLKMNQKVTNTAAGHQEAFNSKTASNAMSIFSDNRDFENIPTETMGETIIAKAENRANKKEASNEESRDIQKPMNTKDSLNKLFG